MSTQPSSKPYLDQEILTQPETADLLRATVRQVARWTSQGRLKGRRFGNATPYLREDVDAFIASSVVKPNL
jgi:hypothetical protein